MYEENYAGDQAAIQDAKDSNGRIYRRIDSMRIRINELEKIVSDYEKRINFLTQQNANLREMPAFRKHVNEAIEALKKI